MSYIPKNDRTLRDRHYLTKADHCTQYWYNFYVRVLEEKLGQYGEDFCLIINGSTEHDDAYVLPMKLFRQFFSKDYVDGHNRWTGYIRDGELYVCVKGHRKCVPAGTFHNAFQPVECANN